MSTKLKISKGLLWTSYVIQGLIVMMFTFGAFANIFGAESAVEGATQMGYPAAAVPYLGVVLLISTLLYAVPQTAALGAILLTAWLGGAIATHVIHRDPFANLLFPVLMGLLIWFAIWLRDARVRAMLQK